MLRRLDNALITCYQDTNVKGTILKYMQKYSLKIDNSSIDYLTDNLGNDSMITKNEIKKLAVYANGKTVDYKTILNAIGDNSVLNLNNLSDSIGIENIDKINYLYQQICNLGLNYTTILRFLSRHFQILIEAKCKQIKNVKDIKPTIHFSRHTKITKQLNNIHKKAMQKYLYKLYHLEIACRNNNDISNLLMKKMLTNINY